MVLFSGNNPTRSFGRASAAIIVNQVRQVKQQGIIIIFSVGFNPATCLAGLLPPYHNVGVVGGRRHDLSTEALLIVTLSLDHHECPGNLGRNADRLAGGEIDEGPIGLGCGQQRTVAAADDPVASQRSDLFHRGDPGFDHDVVAGKGGQQILDRMRADDPTLAQLVVARAGPALRGGMGHGCGLQPGNVDHVVGMAQPVDLVGLDNVGMEEDVGHGMTLLLLDAKIPILPQSRFRYTSAGGTSFQRLRMQRSRMANLWLPAAGIAVGTAVATIAYYYLLKMSPWPPVMKAAAAGLIFALAAAAAAGLAIGIARRCLPALTRRQTVLGIVLGLSCGWGLVIVIPVMPPLGLMPEHWLQVIATGEKNSLSSSPAVWVTGLMDRRTRRLVANAYDFHQDGNWHALTPQDIFTETAGTLTWNGRATSAVALKALRLAGGRQGANRLGRQGAIARSLLLGRPGSPEDDPPRVVRQSRLLDARTGLGLTLYRFQYGVPHRPGSSMAHRSSRRRRGRRTAFQAVHLQTAWEGHPTAAGWAWLGYGLPLLLAGAGYLAVFQPALMSNDSLDQWTQMLSGGYSDVAPAFHTMTNWLITRFWLSPAAIAWTQLVAMSLVTAWTLKHAGTGVFPGSWPGRPAGWWRSCPRRAFFPSHFWKDIPYTICMIVLALMVMEMIQSRGQWLRARLPPSCWARCWR